MKAALRSLTMSIMDAARNGDSKALACLALEYSRLASDASNLHCSKMVYNVAKRSRKPELWKAVLKSGIFRAESES